ncbi:3'-5' exoribonuclease [Shimazuella sp. AN120528]|uniref:3'-5' exoribonuclease domain-containing protein n=1 Tax=Shimazuella soli TaxID=1892854 RepID=UPI001F109528|nr:3'-5' exoribonuclease [Shimazuella soli]MCH5583732.1 3'-5' exoribonuclease [Shimazuella soli]
MMNIQSIRDGVFFDLEFNGLEMISIGFVSPTEEYYAVSAEVDQQKLLADQFLVDNVWAHLPTREGSLDLLHPDVKSLEIIANDIEAYFERNKGRELWGWCPAYDKVILDGIFGGMLNSKAPMYAHDVETVRLLLGNPERPEQKAGLHNSLEDARYQRDLGLWLADRLEEKFGFR